MARERCPVVAIDTAGNAVVGAPLTVYPRNPDGTPNTGAAATCYTTESGSTTVSFPVNSDANGRYPGVFSDGQKPLVCRIGAGGTPSIAQYDEPWDATPGRTTRKINARDDFNVVADGTADDTAALQAAATAAAGGVLFMPPAQAGGYYKVTDDIVIPDDTTVEGAGSGGYWGLRQTLPVGTVIRKTNGDTNADRIFTLGQRCVIRDICFDNPDPVDYWLVQYPAGTNNCSKGIVGNAGNQDSSIVERCAFRYFKAAGIYGPFNLASFRDNHTYVCFRGLDVIGFDNDVRGGSLTQSVDQGLLTNAPYTRVSDVRVEWNKGYGLELNGAQNQVVGCNFDRNGYAGLKLGSNNWVVNGCFFRRNAAYDGHYGPWAFTGRLGGASVYHDPPNEYAKSHIHLGPSAGKGILEGLEFEWGADDSFGGAYTPKYVIGCETTDVTGIAYIGGDINGWRDNPSGGTSITLLATANSGQANLVTSDGTRFQPGGTIQVGEGATAETGKVINGTTPATTSLTNSPGVGATSLTVTSGTGIANGDTISIGNMGSGTRENRVVSAGGGTTTLTVPALTNAHSAGEMVANNKVTLTTNLASTHTTGEKLFVDSKGDHTKFNTFPPNRMTAEPLYPKPAHWTGPYWSMDQMSIELLAVGGFEGGGGDMIKAVSADQAITAVGFVDITGLTYPVVAGKLYQFEAFLVFQTSVTTTGVLFGVNGPASPTLLFVRNQRQVTVSGTPSTDMFMEAMGTAYDTPLPNSTAEISQALNLLHVMRGVIIPSANGTLAMRQSKEVAAGTTTVKAGSFLKIRQLT